jgi:hypothetical protein
MKNDKKFCQKVTMVSALIGSLLVAGCAGNSTIPAQKIAAAESSVNQATKSNAPSDAAVELKNAQDHLADAKAAMERKDYDQASRLADSAAADADLALAKAASAKSKKEATGMRDSVNSLKRELNQTQSK